MSEHQKVSHHQIDSLLCLIRLKENQFFQIHECPNNRSPVLLFSNKGKGHVKIMSILAQHGEESGKHVFEFWTSLKKMMKENQQRSERQLPNNATILRYYSLIIKRIKKFLLNDCPIRKYIQIDSLINKKFEHLTIKNHSAQHQYYSPFSKSKMNDTIFTSIKKKKSMSINNLLTLNIKQKLAKKLNQDSVVGVKRLKKKQQMQNRKFIQTTSKLNNKLFKDLNLQGSLQKFDCNKTRKINSAIIYGDLMTRNTVIKKSINRFQSQTMNKSCHSKSQRYRWNNSSLINPQTINSNCKTLRKTQNLIKKKKLSQISNPIKLPPIEHKKIKLLKRPLTSKQVNKQQTKSSFPLFHKNKKNYSNLVTKQI